MGRSRTGIVVILAPLALLGACLGMAPGSSVPFQAAADRQSRYAAEISLAVKENRRAEASEAAANGRMVLPQLPEIWAPTGADQRLGPTAPGLDLTRRQPAGRGPISDGCAQPGAAPPGDPVRGDPVRVDPVQVDPIQVDPIEVECRQAWQSSALDLPLPGYGWIAAAAAPAGHWEPSKE